MFYLHELGWERYLDGTASGQCADRRLSLLRQGVPEVRRTEEERHGRLKMLLTPLAVAVAILAAVVVLDARTVFVKRSTCRCSSGRAASTRR